MFMIGRMTSIFAATLALSLATPALAEKTPLKVVSGGAFKEIRTISIGAFTVGFIFESVDNSAATGGLVGAFGSTTRAKSELVGVSEVQMQAITDAAYADFRTQLTARGFTVSDGAGLFASPKVARIKPVATPYVVKVKLDPKKDSNGKATFFKPTALPGLMVLAGDITGSGMFSGFSQMGIGIDTQMAYIEHARTTGETVINVIYLIDFSQVKRPGAFSFGGVAVNSGMSVVADYSRLTAITPTSKMAQLLVQTPVAVEGDFATKSDETKDAALQSAANVAGGVAAAFGVGGLSFGKSRTYRFSAKPAYQDGAIKAATLTNERIVGELVTLR